MVKKAWRAPLTLVLKQKPRRLVKGRWFLIKIFSSSLPYARIGAVVPKAVIARATQRNAYKRLIMNSFERAPKLPSADYVVFVLQNLSNKVNRRGMIEELINTFNTL